MKRLKPIKPEYLHEGTCLLYKGSCLQVLKDLEDNSIDLVLADPPYGTTSCTWDSTIPLKPLWKELKRVTRDNTAIVLTANQPFTSILGCSNIKQLRYSWTWKKTRATGHLNGKKMPMKNTEDILVFYKNQPTYNPQGVISVKLKQHNSKSDSLRGVKKNPTSVVSGGIRYKPYTQTVTNYPRQIIEIKSEGATLHPTQKPVALMEYLIKTYTNEGEIVLDFCMGSGSTGVAAIRSARQFIGIELESKYFQIARSRIKSE